MSEFNTIEEIMPQLQNEKIDVIAATSVLHAKVDAIRKEKINWQSYLETSMISEEDYQIITRLDVLSDVEKSNFFNEHKFDCTRTFFRLLTHIPKEQTIQYVLVIVNDLLQEEKLRTDVFHEYAKSTLESGWTPFLNLLNRDDHFITNMAARILTKMACSGGVNTIEPSDLNFFLTWLKDQLLVEDYEYMQSVTRCLQMMLRHNAYRQAFMRIDGVSVLMTVLTRKINFQVEYQIIYCLWVLTFNEDIVEVINKYRVVPVLSDILSDSGKEKVNRITLAVLRNLIEKCPDTKIAREHCMAMIQSKITKQLGLLEQKKYDDEDIVENIAYLLEKLQTTMQDLSSFEEYSTEVKSGRLEWSPVHKSNFWRENSQRLNENNNELLRILIGLLQSSDSPVILCVACFDIGEYVRHYPRGKRIIEQLGGKQAVMQLLTHDDLNVRYEALLAVQKIMVHHWESFGKQLERDKGNGNSSSTAAGSATVSVR